MPKRFMTMKALISFASRCSILLLVLVLTNCASKSKSGDGLGADGGLPSDSMDGSPLGARTEGNPLTDYDLDIFKDQTIYFAFDRSDVQASERGKLEQVADKLKTDYSGKKIMLFGHTDERGTLEYNRSLGERRALAVRNYLIGLGVDASVLGTISYGEELPAEQGTTENAYAQNRRVQVGVYKH